jgi:hypothetical protein
MNNLPQNKTNANNKFSELLEKSRLSRLPSLKKYEPPKFEPPKFDGVPFPVRNPQPLEQEKKSKTGECVNCDIKLPASDDFAQLVGVCRKCLGMHATVDSHLNDVADERSRQAKLQKLAGGVNANR